jgi:hypothetical protein
MLNRAFAIVLVLGSTSGCGTSTTQQRSSTMAVPSSVSAPLTAKQVVAGFRRAGIALSNLGGQPLYWGSSKYLGRYAVFVLITRNHLAAVLSLRDRSHLRRVEVDLVQGAATQSVLRNLVIFIPRRAPKPVHIQIARAEEALR